MDWRNNDYDFRNPGEWPAGRSVSSGNRTFLMDARTPHDEREAEFSCKNAEQIELVIRICRSGRSSQCTPGHPAAAQVTNLPDIATYDPAAVPDAA
ncbi:hypothetical protein [Streptomyces sp. Ac-502]|uniref:hypothetical protein n=1 Tax=Streptomyces sp. Ac-502 TaxID=3342801 RepID=UPI00386237CF